MLLSGEAVSTAMLQANFIFLVGRDRSEAVSGPKRLPPLRVAPSTEPGQAEMFSGEQFCATVGTTRRWYGCTNVSLINV